MKKPPKPVRRVSKKRASEARLYAVLNKVFLDDHATCFRCGSWVPRPLRTTHHFFGRVGALLCWSPGFRMSCMKCHRWVESNRNLAVRLGYRASDRIWNRPSLVIPK